MDFSKISVKRPVTTLMVIFVILAFGLMSLMNLKVDLMPNMNIPIVVVITSYDGAGPEEIKSLVTEPMEEQCAAINGMDTITSTSSNGMSMVMIQFDYDVDIDVAASDVREKIDLVKYSLPDDASDPVVMKIDINSMTGSIMFTASAEGRDITELKKLIEDKVVPRLERVSGVASVSLMGGKEEEIKVQLNEEKMRGYGINETTVSQLISAENLNTPLGEISKGDKNLTLRVKGEYRNIEEIKNIVIPTSTGGNVYLSDVADVFWGYKENTSNSYTNDIESIQIIASKASTANTVEVCKKVFAEMDNIQAEMPDINFVTLLDPSAYINNAINSVVESLLQGALFAVLVLFVFLRDIKSTLIVAISMPVSVVATFAVMNFAGVNFNMMSLGGLTLGIGMLVDNSIVVMESVFKKLEEGCDKITAAIQGGKEVTNSVIASTLTTVGVFLPITMAGGQAAQIFNDMCLTIVFSLICSLVVSVTFVPMAASIFISAEDVIPKKSRTPIGMLLDIISGGIEKLISAYKRLLKVVLQYKKATVAVAFAFVVLTGMVIPTMNFEFMASTDEGQIGISVSTPTGTKTEVTEEIAWKVIDLVRDTPEIKDLSFSVGSGSGASSMMSSASNDTADISITLIGKNDGRKRSTDDIVIEMRNKLVDIAGAEIEVTASGNSMGSYSSSGIEVQIDGEDQETLIKVGDDIVKLMSEIPGLSDVKSSADETSPATTIRINRNKASQFGVSVSSISGMLRTNITGSTATTYKLDGDEYDVTVIGDTDKYEYLSDIESILIPTSTGTAVPLKEFCEIINEEIPTSITREDQTDIVTVSANLNGASLTEAQNALKDKMLGYVMPEGCSWKFGGTTEQMNETFGSLLLALVVAVALVYMIMAAEFESFVFPLIVMFSIPIALTGGIFGNFVAGENVNVTSLLGLIMLAGVVVNNAIVLIDYGNLQMRENGLTYKEAMTVAGPARIRAILMSTLTTVLGMVPMWLSTADGSENMRGLAVTVIFGLSLSTLVTLLLIPAIYVAVNERIEKRRKKKEAKKARKLEKMRAEQA